MTSPLRTKASEQASPPTAGERLLDMFGRSIGVSILFGLAIVWLSLITWSAGDPSPTHATGGSPQNMMGALGAAVSDLLLQTLGLGALVALLAPMLWAGELINTQRVVQFKPRLAYFLASVALFSGAVSSLPVAASWPFQHDFGGILGDGVCSLATSLGGLVSVSYGWLLGAIGLFAAAFVTLCGSLGMSTFDVCRLIAGQMRGAATTMRSKSYDLQEQVRQRAPKLADRMSQMAQASAPSSWAPSMAGAPAAHATPMQPSWAPERAPSAHGEGATFADPSLSPHVVAADVSEPSSPFESVTELPLVLRKHAAAVQGGNGEPVAIPEAPAAPSGNFDALTEAASQAIAKRFAPASATAMARRPEAQQVQHELPLGPALARSNQNTVREGSVAAAQADAAPRAPRSAGTATYLHREAETGYRLPSLNLLKQTVAVAPPGRLSKDVLAQSAQRLSETLADFGVKGEMLDVKPGPVVTLFEFEPARGTKSSRVIGLAEDIARSMGAMSARVAVVPGRNAMGIELPNPTRETVGLRSVLQGEAFRKTGATLPLALGQSISGEPVVADLARMPHLLVAGTTGSGKSVGVNAMILSLLYRYSPEHCRMLMIDPKMLELSIYEGIPHLLCPVITEPEKAVSALDWVVREMEERYKRMAKMSVRSIDVYNNRVRNAKRRGQMLSRSVQVGIDSRTGQAIMEEEQMAFEPMPYIVVVIDEFADLMMTAGKEVELAVLRLAQKARAAGIHLIMATQRPSVDIITGTIKANFPTRISFKVASKVDSRTILNEQGAEQLLGQGDMLFSTGSGQPIRVHGAFVSDEEVEAIAKAIRSQGVPKYVEGITDPAERAQEGGVNQFSSGAGEDLYKQAMELVLKDQRASTSYLQRRLSIGYNRAADLMERLEESGVVSAPDGAGKRQVLGNRGEDTH